MFPFGNKRKCLADLKKIKTLVNENDYRIRIWSLLTPCNNGCGMAIRCGGREGLQFKRIPLACAAVAFIDVWKTYSLLHTL